MNDAFPFATVANALPPSWTVVQLAGTWSMCALGRTYTVKSLGLG